MALKHDDAGFLVGDLLDVNRDLLAGQETGLDILKRIHTQVAAIARALGAQGRTRSQQESSRPANDYSTTAVTPAGRTRAGDPQGNLRETGGEPKKGKPDADVATRGHATVSTVGRDASGRFASVAPASGDVDPAMPALMPAALPVARRETATEPITRTTALQPVGRDASGRFASTTPVPEKTDPARAVLVPAGGTQVPVGRDANGRFGKKEKPDGGDSPDKAGPNLMGRLTDAISGLSGSLNGMDQVDPAIMAMQEVKDAVAPIGRGIGAIFGRSDEKKKERWYSKLLKALTSRNKPDAADPADGGDRGAIEHAPSAPGPASIDAAGSPPRS